MYLPHLCQCWSDCLAIRRSKPLSQAACLLPGILLLFVLSWYTYVCLLFYKNGKVKHAWGRYQMENIKGADMDAELTEPVLSGGVVREGGCRILRAISTMQSCHLQKSNIRKAEIQQAGMSHYPRLGLLQCTSLAALTLGGALLA